MDFSFVYKMGMGKILLLVVPVFIVMVIVLWNRWDAYLKPATEQVSGNNWDRWRHTFRPLFWILVCWIFLAGISATIWLIWSETEMVVGHGYGSIETPVPTPIPTVVPQVPAPSAELSYKEKHYCGVVIDNTGKPSFTITELSKEGKTIGTFPVKENGKVVIGFNNPITGAILSDGIHTQNFKFESQKVWYTWDPSTNTYIPG